MSVSKKSIESLRKEGLQYIEQLKEHKPRNWIKIAEGVVNAYADHKELEPMMEVVRKYHNILHPPEEEETPKKKRKKSK